MAEKLSNEVEKEIINLYNIGKSVSILSNQLNLHRTTIQRVLKRNKIELRKKTPLLMFDVRCSFFL